MPHFKLKSVHLVGFTVETAIPGQMVKVVEKVSDTTSDDEIFHIWINQIYNLFFAPNNIQNSVINTFLIILHADDSADVYYNDFIQTSLVKVNRVIKTGEAVYAKDILDITDIQFPEIQVKVDDAIIYSFRLNWKFGLYFNFGRKLNHNELSKELAILFKQVGFQNLIESTTAGIRQSSAPVFIFTEGKTDWHHLEHAKERLNIDIDISFDKIPDDRGDTTLLEICKHFSRIENEKILIFIFDRDNIDTLNKLEEKTVAGRGFQDWGNNVFSFAIPVPDHRSEYSNISIEFYYTDEEIRTKDKDGKRLFFDNELELRKIPGERAFRMEITPITKTEKEKKIFDKDVFQIINNEGKQIALSKSNFALNVLTKVRGFDNFDVTQFNKIFLVINEIIKYSTKNLIKENSNG